MQTLVIRPGSECRATPKNVAKHDLEVLAKQTLHALERFFALPGVQEDYEKWLETYEGRSSNSDQNDKEKSI